MRPVRLYLALAAAAALACAAVRAGSDDEAAESEHVQQLTAATFAEVASGPPAEQAVLVAFTSPHCGHCKSLKPALHAAAAELAGLAGELSEQGHVPAVVAEVDATVETGLAGEYGVSGYPTLKLFRKGAVVDFDGARTQEALVAFMREHSAGGWQAPVSAVVELDPDSFDDFVAAPDAPRLVMFYAPWCGHCKSMKPAYEKAAKQLQARGIALGRVDATKHGDLGARFDVQGYPTLKIFRQGAAEPYEGGRDEASLVNEMVEQLQPPATEVDSYFDLDRLIHGQTLVVVGSFSADPQAEDTIAVLQKAASPLRKEFRVVYTRNSRAHAAQGVTPAGAEGTVSVYLPSYLATELQPAARSMAVTPDTDPAALRDFIRASRFGLVGHRTGRQQKHGAGKVYGAAELPRVTLYLNADFVGPLRDETRHWLKLLQGVVAADFAEQANRELYFCLADEAEYAAELKELGPDTADRELVLAIHDAKGRRYMLDADGSGDDLEPQTVADFVHAFQAGTLQPRIKSQPAPKRQRGPVLDVVGSTFDTAVAASGKDVFLEVYSPSCGHCRALQPTYKKLAKRFQDADGLTIAKIDGTANDYAPELQEQVRGFPSLFFLPKGDVAAAVAYSGDRSLNDMSKFIRKHATVDLPKPKAKAKVKDEL